MYLGDRKKKSVTLPHSAQKKYDFLVKTKEMGKSKKVTPRRKFGLELLHHRLGHRSNISFMAGYTENVWQDI